MIPFTFAIDLDHWTPDMQQKSKVTKEALLLLESIKNQVESKFNEI